MTQILLLSDCTETDGVFANARPYGLYRIASSLRLHGYSVKTGNHLSSLTDTELERIIELYVGDETILVGISATVLADVANGYFFGLSNDRLIDFFSKIRHKNKNIKFIAGGGQLGNCTDEMRQSFTMFDYIAVGQGEETVVHLANHLAKKIPLKTMSITKPVILSDKVYPFEHIATAGTTFHHDDDIIDGECLPLEIARGCIFKCKFCNYDLTNKKLNEFTRNEDKIKEELLYNYEKFKTQHYYIVDDLLNDSVEKIEMLLRVISTLPFKVYFGAYVRLDMLWRHPEMIPMLKNLGLVSAFLGIETINDKSGSSVGKGLGVKRITETLAKVNEIWNNEIYVEAGFILGLPKDNTDTANELYEWAKVALENRHLHCVHTKSLKINPWIDKSEFSKNPEKYGYTLNDIRVSNFNTMPNVYWTTDRYSRKQADLDAYDIYKKFSDHQWYRLNTFNIPNILSLLDDTSKSRLFAYLKYPDTQLRTQLSIDIHMADSMRKKLYIDTLLQYLE